MRLAGSMSFVQLLSDEWPRVAILKRFLNQPHADDAMRLMAALEKCGVMADRFVALLKELSELEKTEFAPVPLVTGDDLTEARATPGPKFKLALDAAYDAQLEGRVDTKAEAMQLAMALL